MLTHQLSLPLMGLAGPIAHQNGVTTPGKLVGLLRQNLDFHDQDTQYATHQFHAFPAKFPPQLPQTFIQTLTRPGDVVLDPMTGSGTTAVEAIMAGRRAIACDIDPLALRLTQVKATPLPKATVIQIGNHLLKTAQQWLTSRSNDLEQYWEKHWDEPTRDFMVYWFAPETRRELTALLLSIHQVEDRAVRTFFELAFSAIIVTKAGGVSLAFDLAHTRPHRAKVVFSSTGEILLQSDANGLSAERRKVLTKTVRPALIEFEKRVQKNLMNLLPLTEASYPPQVISGNAQQLPLKNDSVDLIVTSPPYASNAIDYMRAHKFSLAWLGYPIDDLGQKRGEYIGGETTTNFLFESLPVNTSQIIQEIAGLDNRKGRVLHRYYSEMYRVLQEMYRVLRPGKVAVVVVGSSVLRGRDTETQHCLAEIGTEIGFQVPHIGTRHLDRDKRMMPAGNQINRHSQIQQRMHEEYVIGFYKPE